MAKAHTTAHSSSSLLNMFTIIIININNTYMINICTFSQVKQIIIDY